MRWGRLELTCYHVVGGRKDAVGRNDVVGFSLDQDGECSELIDDTIASTVALVTNAGYKRFHGIGEQDGDDPTADGNSADDGEEALLDYRLHVVLKGPGATASTPGGT